MLFRPEILVKQAEIFIAKMFLPMAVAGVAALVFMRPVWFPGCYFDPVLQVTDRQIIFRRVLAVYMHAPVKMVGHPAF